MENPIKFIITKDFKSVGTVSYPKKFGSIKFPIISHTIYAIDEQTGKSKSFNTISVTHPENKTLQKKYIQWCLDCEIMKPIDITNV